MRSLKCRSLLTALISLVSISVSLADGIIVVLSGATAGHDKRTGKPVLNLTFTEASKERLRTLSTENVGKKVELRADGRVVLSPVIREPMLGVQWQVSGFDWTDEAVIELAQQLSKTPNGEIELRPVPRSD